HWNTYQKMAGVAICYFIGMTGYESVMVLPAMVFIWILATSSTINIWLLAISSNFKMHLALMGCMLFTLVLHVIVRVNVSGTITGDYGAGFFKLDVLGVLLKSGKVLERLFLPPMSDSRIMIVLFLLLAIITGVVLVRLWKKFGNDRTATGYLLAMLGSLFIALLIPFLFGISTHTSESDRFLHFPSFFFCILISFCLVNLLLNRRSLPVVIAGIVTYNICFLEITNYNWHKASVAVSTLLKMANNQAGKGKLYVVNLPDEIDGAYVFRSGLKEALLVHMLDTASVKIVNQVKRDSVLLLPETINHQTRNGLVYIPPRVVISKTEPATQVTESKEAVIVISPLPEDVTVYWNNKKWVQL
ncbi:MAG TPA: hypothetical protein VF008_31720, partial [Niastella sp.]